MPFLTGEIEDIDSQIVQMPRLPGTFVRTVAWMAPEGEEVDAGDLIVRLDPGDLLSQQETHQIDLEEKNLQAVSNQADHDLKVFDAETRVLNLESAYKIAVIDAGIPDTAIPTLTYERNQLALVNAKNALNRTKQTLEDAKTERDEAIPVNEMMIRQAEANLSRTEEALTNTEIFATQPGLMIYGENPMTGLKVFPGDSFPPSVGLAIVASRENLQFRFWVHEADARKLQLERRLLVTPDALPFQAVEARVTWLSTQAAERDDWSGGGYFEVVAKPLKEVPTGFLPGMSVMAEVLASD